MLQSTSTRPRLLYLDGLRGVAATFVVIHHIHSELTRRHELSPAWEIATRWLQLGHYPVAVFIVVSGFSLMLPVVMSSGLRLEGGIGAFLLRRARRILPAYYVVLLMTGLLAASWRNYRLTDPISWPPRMGIGAIVSHLGVFHNLRPEWCYAIDPPAWSIATEFQIYLLFPILLLPLFRRCGGLATIIVASTMGIGVQLLWGSALGWACPWYVGVFTMGMVAAYRVRVVFLSSGDLLPASDHRLMAERRSSRRGYASVSVLLLLAVVAQVCLQPQWIILADFLIGGFTATFLAWCGQSLQAARRPVAVKILECRAAVFAGDISYSLYLVHYPVIAAASSWISSGTHHVAGTGLLVAVISVTASLLLAILLRRTVEHGIRPGRPCCGLLQKTFPPREDIAPLAQLTERKATQPVAGR